MKLPHRMDKSVVTILKIQARKGKEKECLHWMHDTASVAGRFPGFLSKEIFADTDSGNSFVNIFTFSRREDLEKWENSDERKAQQLIGEVVCERVVEKRQLSALAFMFQENGNAEAQPKKWKMMVVTVVVIFTLLNSVMPLLQSAFSYFGLPAIVKSLLGVAIMVNLMSYFIVPWLGRFLQRWLVR